MHRRVYAKAIQAKPDFDVALANMGNAIKDTVHTSSFGYLSLMVLMSYRVDRRNPLSSIDVQSLPIPIFKKLYVGWPMP